MGKKATLDDLLKIMKEAGVGADILKGIDADSPLMSQGVDSIDLPRIAAAAEKKYGIDLSMAKASNLKTVNLFIAYVNSLVSAKK